jgi:hypothetical protein
MRVAQVGEAASLDHAGASDSVWGILPLRKSAINHTSRDTLRQSFSPPSFATPISALATSRLWTEADDGDNGEDAKSVSRSSS